MRGCLLKVNTSLFDIMNYIFDFSYQLSITFTENNKWYILELKI